MAFKQKRLLNSTITHQASRKAKTKGSKVIEHTTQQTQSARFNLIKRR
jgi:hypothetical protein